MTGFIDSFFKKDKVAFFTLLTFGCVCGAVFRLNSVWWDVLNYHYYNAWAFLNDRLNVDVVPAFINTFFSPFLDLPFYFLINALNDHPVIFSAIMAVPYGLLLFFTYKIAALFFPPDTEQGRIRIEWTLLLCFCSPIVFMETSGISHDHLMTLLVLSALYPLLKGFAVRRFDTKVFLISGFLLGAAAGLKWTYANCSAATGLMLIVFHKRLDNPLKNIVLFTLAGVAGFLTAYSCWGWILWKNFHNPVFPFFNSIFPSPYWEGPDYKDIRYFNKSWLADLFYPFYLFWNVKGDNSLHNRFLVSQFRLIVGMFLFLLPLIGLIGKRKPEEAEDPEKVLLHILMFWMLVVYVLWLLFFRLYRYMIPFELMLSIVLIRYLFNGREIKSRNYLLLSVMFLTFCLIRGNMPDFYKVPLASFFSQDNPIFPVIKYQYSGLFFLRDLVWHVLGMTVFFAGIIGTLRSFLKNKKTNYAAFLAMITGWVIWHSFPQIQRDIFPLELLLSVFLAFFISKWREIKACNKMQLAFFLFTAFCLMECVSLPNTRPYKGKLLPVNAVSLPDNTLLVIKKEPASFFIPFLARNPTIRAVISPDLTDEINGTTFHTSGYFARKRDELIKEYKEKNGKIVYIALNAHSCQPLSTIPFDYAQYYYLCEDDK